MVDLVLLSGSLRRASMNSAVIRIAARSATVNAHVGAVSILPLREIPFYDGDVEKVGDPPAVRAAKEIVDAADGLLIATPEYNGAPSGVLKNALDWLSRPWGDSVLTGKPVATVSAAPGAGGGRKAQLCLREILTELGAEVIPYEPLALSVTGRQVSADLDALVSALVAACRQRESTSHAPWYLAEQTGTSR